MKDYSNVKSADVLFVGAGPVGLYTAIQAKLHNPDLKIVMIERHEEYIRHHILNIEKSSYKGSHPNSEFQKVLEPLEGMVPTSTIETALLQFAKNIGIEIVNDKVTDVNELIQNSTAKYLVGSDGARSIVRHEIFNDEKIVDEDLQYIIEVKYKSKGQAEKLGTLDYGLALSQCEHFIREHTGKKNQADETPVSLFFFVDKATYDEVRELGGTPQKQLKFTDLNVIKSKNLHQLNNSVRPWLAARRYAANDTYIKGSEKISAVALPIYRATNFIKKVDQTSCLLSGDSAMGVPYFRALNAGLIGANFTAKLISNTPLDTKKNETQAESYQRELTTLAESEISTARWTNSKVNLGRGISNIEQNIIHSTLSSSMEPTMLTEMQDARMNRPNIFIRNPRVIAALFLFLMITATLFLSGGLSSIPLIAGLAINTSSLLGCSMVSGTIILAGSALLKSAQLIKNFVFPSKKLDKKKIIVQFPWENNTNETPASDDLSSTGSVMTQLRTEKDSILIIAPTINSAFTIDQQKEEEITTPPISPTFHAQDEHDEFEEQDRKDQKYITTICI